MAKEKANPSAVPGADNVQVNPVPVAVKAPPKTIAIKTCPASVAAFQPADVVERRFIAQIPHTDSFEDILVPEYWAHHAAKVSPRALITCIDEHLRWEAEMRVLEAGQTWLKLAVLRHTEYTLVVRGEGEIERLRSRYVVEQNGQNGWRIIGPTGQQLVSGLATESNARAYLDSHLAALSLRPSAA